MSTISSDDLRAILAGCDGVTPGPWEQLSNCISVSGSVDTYSGPVLGTIAHTEDTFQEDAEGRTWSCRGDRARNAAHIARLDPQTVAAICRELLSLRESHPIEDGEGWVLVPREPTEAMLEAGREIAAKPRPGAWRELLGDLYRAEIAASPSNPGTSKVEKLEHSDKLRQGLQAAVDSINSRPPELRGSFKSPAPKVENSRST